MQRFVSVRNVVWLYQTAVAVGCTHGRPPTCTIQYTHVKAGSMARKCVAMIPCRTRASSKHDTNVLSPSPSLSLSLPRATVTANEPWTRAYRIERWRVHSGTYYVLPSGFIPSADSKIHHFGLSFGRWARFNSIWLEIFNFPSTLIDFQVLSSTPINRVRGTKIQILFS